MSGRAAARLAWSLWALCVALIGLTLLLDFLTDDVLGVPPGRESPGIAVLTGVLSLAYPTVGALIASRLPRNPIGWIFCGVGLFYTAQRFSTAYADYALLENLAFPGGEYVAWFSTLVRFSGLVLTVVFVMLLFPDGRLLSRRWQIVAWMAVLGAVLTALYDAFYPDYLSKHVYVYNPFAVVVYIGPFTPYEFFIGSALVGEALLLTSSFAALFSLVLRLHRARGDERQQLKWFLYAAVPAGVAFGFVLVSFIVVDFTDLFQFSTPLMELRELIVSWDNYEDIRSVGVIALLVVPVFTYIAILRHRLYDIDVVINRTLVYGALTVVFAGIFVIIDEVAQELFLAVTRQLVVWTSQKANSLDRASGSAVPRCKSQNTKTPELRFRVMLGQGNPEVRFERAAV